jgi:hypothetical protein
VRIELAHAERLQMPNSQQRQMWLQLGPPCDEQVLLRVVTLQQPVSN